MDDIYKILHELNDNLIDVRSVIKASDEVLTAQFKRHINLVITSSQKIDLIQKKIDDLIAKQS